MATAVLVVIRGVVPVAVADVVVDDVTVEVIDSKKAKI